MHIASPGLFFPWIKFIVCEEHKFEGKCAKEWVDGLQEIFKEALNLKILISLCDKELVVRWPRANDKFDEMTISLERSSRAEAQSTAVGHVHVALTPALLHRERVEDGLERQQQGGRQIRTLSYALVVLQ